MIRLRQLFLFDPPQAEEAEEPEPTLFGAQPASAGANLTPIPASPTSERESASPRLARRLRNRLRGSWRVQARGPFGWVLELPPALYHAPAAVQDWLDEWARLALGWGKRRPERVRLRKDLEKRLWEYWESRRREDPGEARKSRRSARSRIQRLNAQGRHHDLQAIFESINREYFGGSLQARVTWSSRWGGLSTHSERPDGEGGTYHLISISRGYDHPSASPEIVGGVMHHECLHIAIPPRMQNGRRVAHGPEFRRREKTYAHFDAWIAWHRRELPRVLRKGPPRD